MTLFIILSSICILCGYSSLRIKTNPYATKVTDDTFINVFDADDDQRYFLYPTKLQNNKYSLDHSIKLISNKHKTFKHSIISIKTTDNSKSNIFSFPYEICLGTVIGMNDKYSSFIIQTAGHCVIDHPQFQTSSKAHIQSVDSLLIYVYTQIYHDPVIYLGIIWIVIIIAFCLCFWWLSCKFVLLGFAALVVVVNVTLHFGEQEMNKNDASKFLKVMMDIKYPIYSQNKSIFNDDMITTLSNECEILYFSMNDMLDYNHIMMDIEEWDKLLFNKGDFAFLKCEYNPDIYGIISKYIKPSYPKMVDKELLNAIKKVKKSGLLNFDNVNKYVMISGSFQRFVHDTPNGFIDLHRKKICKQYIDECMMERDLYQNGENTNELLLEDMIEFISKFENERDNEYEYKLYSSVGKVNWVHSDQYFIGEFGAIQGWSGGVGVIADNLKLIEDIMKDNGYGCILVRGSLEMKKYKGNWCMLVTHKVYAATYWLLLNGMSEYFDIEKIDRKYINYGKRMRKDGFGLGKFGVMKKDKSKVIEFVFKGDDIKIEI